MVALAALTAAPLAHAAISSLPDAPSPGTEFGVSAVAPAGDNLWIGGGFSQVGPRSGPAALFGASTGVLTQGSPEFTDATPLRVNAIVSDGGTGWFVGGSFGGTSTLTRPSLIHVLSTGAVDTGWNAGVTGGAVSALALGNNGKLYIAGAFTGLGGQPRPGLGAVSAADGSLDGWNPALTGAVHTLTFANNVVYAGGTFTAIGGQARSLAAALDPVTGAANGFNPNVTGAGGATVEAIVVQGGSAYLGGFFNNVGGTAINNLAQVNDATGVLVATWVPDPSAIVRALATDGTNLYVGGSFQFLGANVQARIGLGAVGLTSNPADATTWAPVTSSLPGIAGGFTVNTLLVSGTRVYIGGSFKQLNGLQRSNLAAATTAGVLDPDFDPEPGGQVFAVAPAPLGAVYAGGRFSIANASVRASLAQVSMIDGTLQSPTHTFDSSVDVMAMCGNTLYVGGAFGAVDTIARSNAAAFDATTGALLGWDPEPDNGVQAIACDNNVVYLGGNFAQINAPPPGFVGIPRPGLAAVEAGGTGTATTFDAKVAGGGVQVTSLALSGTTLYVGGSFTSIGSNSLPRADMAALDTGTAAADPVWDPSLNQPASSIAVTADRVFISGLFTTVKGVTYNRIAAIPRVGDGTADTGFNPSISGAGNWVRSVSVAPDGTVYAAGDFNTAAGQPRNFLAAFDQAGTLLPWNPNPNAGLSRVYAGPDRRVYVGGAMTGVDGRAASGLATFSEPTSFASQPSLSPAPVEGQVTTCDGGTPGGSLPAPQTFQWQLDGAPISGATTATYTPAAGDVGHSLSCHVSMRNLISSAQADSAPASVAAAPVAPAQQSAPAAPPPTPPFDIDGQPTPPPPVRGKSVVAEPVSGRVLVLLPGFKVVVPLPDAERIPVGTIIDATHGVVKLTSVGKNGKLQSAIFYEGIFQVFQGKEKNAITELRLFGGNFAVCKKAKRAGALIAGKIPKSKSIRHLWGEGKGLFRTKGRYASATIRGTKWLTDDRCDGTLIRVAKGAVTVRDLVKKKSFPLKAPKRYLAKAR